MVTHSIRIVEAHTIRLSQLSSDHYVQLAHELFRSRCQLESLRSKLSTRTVSEASSFPLKQLERPFVVNRTLKLLPPRASRKSSRYGNVLLSSSQWNPLMTHRTLLGISGRSSWKSFSSSVHERMVPSRRRSQDSEKSAEVSKSGKRSSIICRNNEHIRATEDCSSTVPFADHRRSRRRSSQKLWHDGLVQKCPPKGRHM